MRKGDLNGSHDTFEVLVLQGGPKKQLVISNSTWMDKHLDAICLIVF